MATPWVRWAGIILGLGLLLALALLVVVSLIVPPWVEGAANDAIAENEDFDGQVGDVGINWWRRSLVVRDVVLVARAEEGSLREARISRAEVHLGLASLWEGAAVLDVTATGVAVSLEPAPPEEVEEELYETLAELPPFQLENLLIREAEITWHDAPHTLHLVDGALHLQGLSNLGDDPERSLVTLRAVVGLAEGGRIRLAANANPLATPQPDVYLDLRLEELALAPLGALAEAPLGAGLLDGRLEVTSRLGDRPTPAPETLQVGDLDLRSLQVTGHVDIRDLEPVIAGVDEIRVPSLQGDLAWLPGREETVVLRGRVTTPRAVVSETGLLEEAEPDPEAPEPDELLAEAPPFRVDRFEVIEGTVTYLDPTVEPTVDVTLAGLHLDVSDVTNAPETLARARLEAVVAGSGQLEVLVAFVPLAAPPAFSLQAELRDLHLPDLNDAWEAYGGFDTQEGTAHLFTEIASQDGAFVGYVRPFAVEPQFYDADSWSEGVGRALQEGAMQLGAELLGDVDTGERVATEVPLEGHIEDPDIGIWRTVVMALRNAFIEAIVPEVEGRIDLGDVG